MSSKQINYKLNFETPKSIAVIRRENKARRIV